MLLKERYPQADSFFLPGGSTAVLMIHGFTATPSQMRMLGNAIHGEGYTVKGMLLPGHGTSLEDMVTKSWQDWLRAVRGEVVEMLSRYEKLVVAGLSMGGTLALLMAEEMPLDGVIAMAPALRLIQKFVWLMPLYSKLVPFKEKPNFAIEEDNLRYDKFPTVKVPDLVLLARMARLGLPHITCPMLVAQGRHDEMVRAQVPGEIMEGTVNCHDKKLLWLENSPHVCTNQSDFDTLFPACLAFIRQVEAMKIAH